MTNGDAGEATPPTDDVAVAGGFSLDKQSAEDLRTQAATRRRELELSRIEMERTVEAARADMEAQRQALEAKFREQENALMARIAPMKAELERLQEMSWTVDLYLGRHEEVTLIKDGKPAPADTPITVRQMVLAADEESLILGEEATFDHRDMGTFIEWLVASAENRDRIIPDERGVVVVVPTRQERRSGNAFEDAARAAANRQAHWIIRNGERLYLMVTEDERLSVGERILPKRDEFVKFFHYRAFGASESKPLEPGSARWIAAEDKADAVKKHYMRLMLILQGLIDRTVAFHPLPENGVNLMSVAAQDLGHVRLMQEDDMVLTDGRPAFREWQRRLNSQLRVGMRVVLGNGIGQHGYDHGYRNSRISPANASHPPTSEPLMIEAGSDKKGFVVRYERTDTVWRRGWIETKPGWGYYGDEEVTPTRRASARFSPDDHWVLPFDLATEADLTYYLNSREARRKYQDMVPVIRAALRAKETEREAEAPLRRLMLNTLAAETGDEEEAERELSDLIAWWKVGHRYANALAGDAATESEAAVAIMAEWRKRQKAKPNPAAAKIVVDAAKSIPGALVAAYTRSKKFIVLARATENEPVYVHEHVLSKDGAVVSTKEWTTPNSRVLATMVTLWESEGWASWDKYPDTSMYLTGPEREAIIETLKQRLIEQGASVPILAIERGTGYNYHKAVAVFAWLDGVDVSDHEAFRAKSKDMWSSREAGFRAFVRSSGVVWNRKDGEVVLANSHEDWVRRDRDEWERYNGDEVPLPYRSGDRYRPESDDAMLVWSDDEQLERAKKVLAGHLAKKKADEKAKGEESQASHQFAMRCDEALRQAYLERLTAKARADFIIDFGQEAADDKTLWDHHLGTLKLARKIPSVSDNFTTVIKGLHLAGINVDGLTVAEALKRYNTEVATTPVTMRDIDTWGDFTITLPAADGARGSE